MACSDDDIYDDDYIGRACQNVKIQNWGPSIDDYIKEEHENIINWQPSPDKKFYNPHNPYQQFCVEFANRLYIKYPFEQFSTEFVNRLKIQYPNHPDDFYMKMANTIWTANKLGMVSKIWKVWRQTIRP